MELNFTQIILFTSFILGFIVSLILYFFNNSPQKKLNRLLLLTLFPLTLLSIITFLYKAEWIINFPQFLQWNRPIFFLLGPGLFLYIKKTIAFEPKLERRDYLHFSPFLIDLAVELFYTNSRIGNNFPTAGASISEKFYIQTQMNCSVANCWINYLIFASIIIYFFYSWRMYFRIHDKNRQPSFNWVKLYLFTQTIFFLISVTSLLLANFNEYFVEISMLIWGTALIFISILLLINPAMLYGLNLNAEELSSQIIIDSRIVNEFKVNEKLRDKYLRSIEDFLCDNDKVARPKLSLSKMSEELKIPPHQLSALINQEYKTNFNDLLNKRRIEIAKSLLLDHNCKCYSLEGIGSKAGFSSKTSFYTSFKKFTGSTPAEFAKKVTVE